MKQYQKVPIFGKIEIELNKESLKISEFFEDDLNRLSKIDQLGILHSFLNIPEYKKSDYMNIMLYLMRRAVLYNTNQNINFENEIKLIGKTNFSSAEEFLKSWALLYSIGHLPMTFATEHSFMRFLSKDNNQKKFINKIKEILENSGFDLENGNEKDLFILIKSIIEEERYMEIYKVFSLLKILKNDNLKNPFYSPKIKELAKIMVLREGYLNHLSNIDQKIKLEKMINYFIIIRKLTYTILDGYISQNHLNLNYFVIFENLDSFMENEDYQALLDDINKFYTFNIFNSPESAYYHHKCVLAIDEVFKEFDIEDLVDKMIENDEELEEKINIATSAENKLSENRFYESELKDHIRFNVDYIKKPIEREIISFNKGKIFGGLLYNRSKKQYEIDIYPNSELSDKRNILFNVIESLNNFYFVPPEFILSKTLKHLTVLYKLVKSDYPDLYNNEVMDVIKKDENFLFDIEDIFDKSEFRKLLLLIDQFKDVANYLFINSIINQAHFSSWNLGYNLRIDFPILFRKTELEAIISILKTDVIVDKKLELAKNIEQLELELVKDDDVNKTFYVFSPNTDFLRKTEIDFMLIKFKLAEKEKIVIIGEVKPNSKFNEQQCVKQIELIFNISSSSALALYKSTMEHPTSKDTIRVDVGGEKIKDMIIFEKIEKIEKIDDQK